MRVSEISCCVLSLLFCTAAFSVSGSACASERQPNILVFLMDDMGYGSVRDHPQGAGFETPHLDFLLETGVILPMLTRLLCLHQHDMHCSPVIMSIADAILVVHGIFFR